ncbi:MAG TPA: gamma-glutamyltransferase [Rhizomicrobium sp.]|jgi:gamma-glutamyltranspeptidase/glutathione hydrolase|nr:gamma-glutamyltransferase [Rhizomicrobium sp.]
MKSANLGVAIVAFLLFVSSAQAQVKPSPHEAIASASPYASAAGLKMMEQGGSAVDAAIAAQMVLTLVEPESSGIGGGAFMMLYDPRTHRTTSFDGREIAPASATPTMFQDANGKPRGHFDVVPGGLSVGVPGVVAMMKLAHDRYGKLPWATLFQPAIDLSENGFPVGRKLAATLRSYPQMARMPDIKRYFYHADGTPLAQGEILKNPELAATLRAIAKDGPAAFYSGPVAEAIVDAVQHAPVNPGGMQLSDLASYQARERPPVCGAYRIYHLCSMGPPSSGGISVLQILGMLERFPSKDLQPNTLSEVHLFSEASRLAFADRAKYIADSDVVSVPIAGLLDRNYLHQRAALIDPAKDMGTAKAGDPPMKKAEFAPQRTQQLPGTSHMSIVDSRGEVVSMTTTVEFVFGSEMMAKGFFLNNQLTDFSFDSMRNGKPVANAPAPGKRPMSAMAPTIVFDAKGHFEFALGSPGGPAIIPFVAETLVAMIDGHLGPQAAAGLPHHVNPNGPTILEADTSIDALAPQLTQMGHTVRLAPLESGLNIIEHVKGGYIGGADPRRDGDVEGN